MHINKDDTAAWILDRSDELGLGCLHLVRLPEDDSKLDGLPRKPGNLILKLICKFPKRYFSWVNRMMAMPEFCLSIILIAQKPGAQILRTGYGRLTLETSRFNQNLPLRQHMDKLARSLQIASDMMNDTDMMLAIENHCDFTGEQLADILDAVGSPCWCRSGYSEWLFSVL